jgi:hypothetical protein
MSFNNRATMKEKLEQLRNDQRNASTLHQFAQSEAGEISGRWAKPQTVNASRPTVEYPRIPSGPWAGNDPSGVEPPLGIDVNEPVVTGESFEVEQSLDENYGLQRLLRDRNRPATPTTPVCESVAGDGATAVSPSSPSGLPRPVESDLGKGPHVASEDGVINRDCKGAPSSKPNIKRRLR